jgi:hypothetical protein
LDFSGSFALGSGSLDFISASSFSFSLIRVTAVAFRSFFVWPSIAFTLTVFRLSATNFTSSGVNPFTISPEILPVESLSLEVVAEIRARAAHDTSLSLFADTGGIAC